MTQAHRKWTHKRYVWETVYKWAWSIAFPVFVDATHVEDKDFKGGRN